MKREKTVEGLLRSYRENKSEIKMLSYGLDLQAIQYDKERVQTSNKSDISDIVVAREKRLIELLEDVSDTEALLDSLEDKDRFIIESTFIKGKTHLQVASALRLSTEDAVTKAKARILKELRYLYNKVKKYREVS
ncbi:hypothetical protein LZ906_017365 (plasmid) [Paraclostridium ghonii]|uniref:hypothetical protein n=1 Tax=Paraclostridium ghonii TaxID=29358 RepID=UPI00202CE170|nr:hypothetical protein [Paeniclostridium ghonii]MCM0167620.1 hypothetical protein [Paeniclostridium ghonii]